MDHTIIFCDGASKGNPGPGGWGAVVVQGRNVTELGGREDNATNNQMELKAAVEALKFALSAKSRSIRMNADSSYVINGITKWVFSWKRNGWKTKEGKAVLNESLWKDLDSYANRPGTKVEWNYVGGHIGVAGNHRVDEIASGLALGKNIRLYSGPLGQYGIDVLNTEHDKNLKDNKAAARSRSKLPAYSYVSEVDGEVRVHKIWKECESRIKGKKARFKKAASAEEERQLVEEYSEKKV